MPRHACAAVSFVIKGDRGRALDDITQTALGSELRNDADLDKTWWGAGIGVDTHVCPSDEQARASHVGWREARPDVEYIVGMS